MARHRAERPPSFSARLLVAVGCDARRRGDGLRAVFGGEPCARAGAVAGRIHPDAVTISEACSGDVARIARRTGYHQRFATVICGGEPFRCIHPGGRGVFGDAVLIDAPIVSVDRHAFAAQAGIEQRRWLCVTSRAGVDVCTAHLATRDAVEVAGNDGQCPELAAILARRPPGRAVIFGGDVNRLPSCAPAGFWARTDATAEQAAGLQQVYGSGALRSPSAQVAPFAHSDHDVLLVRGHLERGSDRLVSVPTRRARTASGRRHRGRPRPTRRGRRAPATG